MKLPKSNKDQAVGREARKKIPLYFNSGNWDHHEQTGNDFGLDMTFDYIEKGIVTGRKIEVQIKGRSNPVILKTGVISFPLYTITINYALASGNPFLLMLYLVKSNEVYFLDIKDYFSSGEFSLELDVQDTINVHIPLANICAIGENERFYKIVNKSSNLKGVIL